MTNQNLGKLDRVFRFALAFWLLGPWAPSFDVGFINMVIVIIGWIALVESFWGYCWLQKVLGIDNKSQ